MLQTIRQRVFLQSWPKAARARLNQPSRTRWLACFCRPSAHSVNPTTAPLTVFSRDDAFFYVHAPSRHTSKLIRAGFLLPRRDVGREEAYWFSMPQVSAR